MSNYTEITVNTELNEDEICEYDGVYTVGDSILNQFFYGNYTDSINKMLEVNITPQQIGEYLEEKAEEFGCNVSDLYNNHFTLSYMASIGETYGNAIARGL